MNKQLKEIWQYREFLKYDTYAKLKVRHKGTVLGYFWWLLDPLLFMGIYYLIVKVVFDRGGPDYPVFVFLALLPWRWFTSTLGEATNSIRGKAGLIKQVYFPKINIVLAVIMANFVNFLFGFILVLALIVIFRIPWTMYFIYFPIVMLVQMVFTMGLSLILADLNVFFKDVGNLLKYVLMIWFFLSPGIYPAELIPERFLSLYSLNPFFTFFEGYRNAILNAQAPNLFGLLIIFLLSLGLIVIGLVLFNKNQGNYAKLL